MSGTLENTIVRNQHIKYIDVLRVISMISVVFLHTAAGSLRGNLNSPVWHVSNILTSIMSSSVPIFFMISGAMLLTSEKTLSIGFTYKKRLPKVLFQFLAWSIIAVIYFGAISFITTGNFDRAAAILKLKNIVSQPTTVHLWFMYALIPLYILSPILKSLTDALSDKLMRYFIMIWLIFSSVVPTLSSLAPAKIKPFFILNPSYDLNFMSGYLGYFILGYLLFKYKKPVSKRILTCIIVLDTTLISVGTWFKSTGVGQYSELFKGYSRVFMLILSASLFLLIKEIFRNRDLSHRSSELLGIFSSASFGIYLIHNLLVNLISKKITLGPANSLLTLFGSFFAVLLASLVLIILAASIKPFCYVLTGLSYKNACETMNVQFFIRKLSAKVRSKAEKVNV